MSDWPRCGFLSIAAGWRRTNNTEQHWQQPNRNTPAAAHCSDNIAPPARPSHLVAHLGEEAAQRGEGGGADQVRALAAARAAAVVRAAEPAVALVRRRPAVPPLQPVLVLLALKQALAADRKRRVLRGHTHRCAGTVRVCGAGATAATAPGGVGAGPARGACDTAGPWGGAWRAAAARGASGSCRRAAGRRAGLLRRRVEGCWGRLRGAPRGPGAPSAVACEFPLGAAPAGVSCNGALLSSAEGLQGMLQRGATAFKLRLRPPCKKCGASVAPGASAALLTRHRAAVRPIPRPPAPQGPPQPSAGQPSRQAPPPRPLQGGQRDPSPPSCWVPATIERG